MKEKLKLLWEGIKKRDLRSLFFAALICALPVFLYSILGSILFGITLSPDDVWLHVVLIPFYFIFAYFLGYFLYVVFYVWIYKGLKKLLAKKK